MPSFDIVIGPHELIKYRDIFCTENRAFDPGTSDIPHKLCDGGDVNKTSGDRAENISVMLVRQEWSTLIVYLCPRLSTKLSWIKTNKLTYNNYNKE